MQMVCPSTDQRICHTGQTVTDRLFPPLLFFHTLRNELIRQIESPKARNEMLRKRSRKRQLVLRRAERSVRIKELA